MKWVAVPAAAFLVVSGTMASPVTAQESPPEQSSLSVSPAIVDNTLDPGTAFDLQVAVSNLTAIPVAVRSSARELISNEEVEPQYATTLDSSSWFTIDQPDFLLLAQERREVTIRVAVPEVAEPGGHYATVNFDSFVPGQQSDGVTLVNARISLTVLLTVNGDVRERVTSTGPIDVGGTFKTEALPTTFGVTLRNEGNVHVVPQGQFVVRDVFGNRVEELPIPQQTLLPGTRRVFQSKWEHGLQLGVFNVEAELVAGQQVARVEVPRTRFVVFPLVVVIPVAVLVVLIIGMVTITARRRRRASGGAAEAEPRVAE